MAQKIRKDDVVEIISGNDKGKRGRVLQVLPTDDLLVVEGINLRKHHEPVRQTKAGRTGGIEEREAPIHQSNVAFIDPKTNRPARIGFAVVDGKKKRVTKGKNASRSIVD